METELESGAKVLVDYINNKAYFQLDGKNRPIQVSEFVRLVEDKLITQTGDIDGHWIYQGTTLVKKKEKEKHEQSAVVRWLNN